MVDDAGRRYPPLFLSGSRRYQSHRLKVLAMMNTIRLSLALLLVMGNSLAAQVSQPVPSSAPTPPEEITYVVRPGDTLWDIAAAYLKDPFRWPEIFRRNRDVVENAHWIYPGERIRIAAGEIRDDAVDAARGGAPASTIPRTDASQTVFASELARRNASGGFVGLIGRETGTRVRRGEIETAPYLDTLGGPPLHGRIHGTVERFGIRADASDRRFQLNDRVYIVPPANRVGRIGERFLTYSLGPEVGEASQVVIPTGILLVDSLREGGLVRARLIRQFGPVTFQQGFLPLTSLPVPGYETPVTVAGASLATVLWVHNDPVLPSLQHYLLLDTRGIPPVSIGDLFTLVDPGTARDDRTANPPEDVGLIQIVRVTPYGATGIVVNQTQPAIKVGMKVRLSARIP